MYSTILKGGRVKRFHTITTITNQTVAEHTFGVIALCFDLTGGKPSIELITAALQHDVSEQYTGDIPAPVKWEYPLLDHWLKEIEQQKFPTTKCSKEDSEILRLADGIELAEWCVHEASLGNKMIFGVFCNIINSIKETTNTVALEIIESLTHRMEDIQNGKRS